MRVLFVVGLFFCLATHSYAFKKNSSVSQQIEVTKDGSVNLTFTVQPDEGLAINDDENSPWTVQLKDASGLEKSEYELDKSKFDGDLPGFKLSTKLEKADKATFSGKVRLVAFVCTTDKTRCYRDVHKLDLQYPPKKSAPDPKKS